MCNFCLLRLLAQRGKDEPKKLWSLDGQRGNGEAAPFLENLTKMMVHRRETRCVRVRETDDVLPKMLLGSRQRFASGGQTQHRPTERSSQSGRAMHMFPCSTILCVHTTIIFYDSSVEKKFSITKTGGISF